MPVLLKDNYSQYFFNNFFNLLHSQITSLNRDEFFSYIFNDNWSNLELKERMSHISNILDIMLPGSYESKINILKNISNKAKYISKHSGYLCLFLPDYVEKFGLNDWQISINALEKFTNCSSSEFAVRKFILQDEDKMMAQMQKWSQSNNHHVRRLSSEGCRPRLPWGISLPAFKKNPDSIIPILDMLKDDESEYVRRSVANNLNDISKDNPDIVIDIARKWYKEDDEVRYKLLKHACRGLLKKANGQILELFGFNFCDNIKINHIKIDNSVIRIGDSAIFDLNLDIVKSAKIRFEYAIYYLKSNNKYLKKIFQIKEGDFAKGKFKTKFKHSFRQMTTRKHYPGKHKIAIILNGVELEELEFTLE